MSDDIDDDDCVLMLVAVIFRKKVLNTEEMRARNPPIPICLFTEDFIRSFQDVLLIKRSVVFSRWQTFFDICYKKMFTSHKMFLTFVMFACISENECNQNIFESFVSVCALIKLLCDETLQKTGVNFCGLIPDIFMVFYMRQFKTIFCRRHGFRRLVEYICEHRYLKWKLNKDYSVLSDDPTALVIALENEKLKKELKRDRVIATGNNPDIVARDKISRVMAGTVLSLTLVKLPTLPSFVDLQKSVMTYREKKIAKDAEELQDMKVALQECSSLKSESKTNCIVKHHDNIEQYENIIQAVIKHNQSKSSSNETRNNQVQEKAEGVLEHLKDKIKSLIEVLDEYDKE